MLLRWLEQRAEARALVRLRRRLLRVCGDEELLSAFHAGELARLQEIDALRAGRVVSQITIRPDEQCGYHLFVQYVEDVKSGT